MNITKLVLTEADGTTIETISTNDAGFSAVTAVLTDGSEVKLFPMTPPNSDPAPTPESIAIPLNTPVILTARV